MSSVIKALILGEMKDLECVEEALKRLNITYKTQGNFLVINNDIRLEKMKTGIKVLYQRRYESSYVQMNNLVANLTRTYAKVLEEKIERLKLEEARLQEEKTLQKFNEAERKAELLKIERERLKLEAIKRKEEIELQKTIQTKREKIKELAQKLGFKVNKEVKGKETIFVFVRS